MKNRKVMAVALTLLALGVLTQTAPRPARAAGAQGDEAALTEALKRLEKTLTRHGSMVIGGVLRRFEGKDFRGCRIIYERTPQVAPDHKGFKPYIERFTIDLSALDPARVEVRGGDNGAVVIFSTRVGDRAAIETRLADEPHTFGDATRFRANHFSLTNRAGAEEVRAALVRAVELCGR